MRLLYDVTFNGAPRPLPSGHNSPVGHPAFFAVHGCRQTEKNRGDRGARFRVSANAGFTRVNRCRRALLRRADFRKERSKRDGQIPTIRCNYVGARSSVRDSVKRKNAPGNCRRREEAFGNRDDRQRGHVGSELKPAILKLEHRGTFESYRADKRGMSFGKCGSSSKSPR